MPKIQVLLEGQTCAEIAAQAITVHAEFSVAPIGSEASAAGTGAKSAKSAKGAKTNGEETKEEPAASKAKVAKEAFYGAVQKLIDEKGEEVASKVLANYKVERFSLIPEARWHELVAEVQHIFEQKDEKKDEKKSLV